MSKRQFKIQASSSRAYTKTGVGAFGSFGSSTSLRSAPSQLSYITEPLEYSLASDPNVTIALKGLSKKDSATKVKALEDLQAYLSSLDVDGDGVEDGILEAWTRLYPRTSIDNALRVRQLAHMFQGQISLSSGKRIAKYMPTVVGAWLAGRFDNDRSVARAALTSFNSVFPSEEKRRGVWVVFEKAILSYSRDAALEETPSTLSDERTVSPDDAEGKYARVVATSLSVVTNLLEEIPEDKIREHNSLYEDFLSSEKLWSFLSNADAFIRRSTYKLLRMCIKVQKDFFNSHLELISSTVIVKGLSINQTGSSWDYIELLTDLTKIFPTIWTDAYLNKKSATSRLCHFLSRGSQGSGFFYSQLAALFRCLPLEIFPSTLPGARDMLDSLRKGINSKPEGIRKSDTASPWITYIALARKLFIQIKETQKSPNADEAFELLRGSLIPIIDHHLWCNNKEWKEWVIGQGSDSTSVFYSIIDLPTARSTEFLTEQWSRLATTLIENMKKSLPEQSQGFEASQREICQQGERWFILQKEILNDIHPHLTGIPPVCVIIQPSSLSIIREAMSILKSRNGKPFGAASMIESCLRETPGFITDTSLAEELAAFFTKDITYLVSSPSFSFLSSALFRFSRLNGQNYAFETSYTAASTAILQGDLMGLDDALRTLLTPLSWGPEWERELPRVPELDTYFSRTYALASQGDKEKWSILSYALKFSSYILSPATTDSLLSGLVHGLSTDDKAVATLNGLQILLADNKGLFTQLLQSEDGASLISNLLSLCEAPDDDVAAQAEKTCAEFESILTISKDAMEFRRIYSSVLKKSLLQTDHNSISVDHLAERAVKLHDLTAESYRASLLSGLLPNDTEWEEMLRPFLNISPDPSMAIGCKFAGATHIIDPTLHASNAELASGVDRDREGYSPALRCWILVLRLSESTGLLKNSELECQDIIIRNLILVLNLAKDNLSLVGANNLWLHPTPEVETSIEELISYAQMTVQDWLHAQLELSAGVPLSVHGVSIRRSIEYFADNASDLTSFSFYNSRALSLIYSVISEASKRPLDEKDVPEVYTAWSRESKDALKTVALLTGLNLDPKANAQADRFVNELVEELTEADASADSEAYLIKLVLLSIALQNLDEAGLGPSQRRVLFLANSLISSHSTEGLFADKPDSLPSANLLLQWAVAAEVLRLLNLLLPYVKELYGEHWNAVLGLLGKIWTNINREMDPYAGEKLPAMYGVLRLLLTLKKLRKQSNEDLEEALQDFETEEANLLLTTFKASHLPDESHQPLRIVNDLLCRLVHSLSTVPIKDPNDLYQLLHVRADAVQQTAFELLHGRIPEIQGQVSIDIALAKISARLPPELLSLVIEAPKADHFDGNSFEYSIPLSLRGYLYAWRLIFDHFSNASHKVRSDYIESIHRSANLTGLLDFAFELLEGKQGKLADVSNFNISDYLSDMEENSHKNLNWLLAHIYYLCLEHAPALTKKWWLDLAKRQRQLAILSWTEKFVSPLIIASALEGVSEWAQEQESSGEREMTIKVSKKAREVIASFEVDEQAMSIVIRLPNSFPLENATVEGVNRLAANERDWQGWLLSTRGVIRFSNGGIIEGLMSWRRAVAGALKGQTECSICYSLISEDKQLPSKRCATCSNLFHSFCLLKWFKSSNTSSCPLCRNPFNYASN